MPESNEEFELIPLSPLRKLEKRIEELESKLQFKEKDLYKEMIEIIRLNQQIVDELVKANDALRIELSKLPMKIEELTKSLGELIEMIKASAEEETQPKTTDLKPLTEKLDKLIEINKKIVEDNENLLLTLDKLSKRLKPLPPPPVRKPLLPQKPI